MIDVNEIPQPLLNRIKEQFYADPQIIRLRLRQRELISKGLFNEALNVGKTINELYERVVYSYLKEAEETADRVDLNDLPMTDEDKDAALSYAIVMFMCCDIIESAIMDINDKFRKYDKDLSFEMFNDIRQLSAMVKEKLKWLQKNSGYMKDLAWANQCDNMYGLMQNKAKSIMRKRKSKNWGKNMINS